MKRTPNERPDTQIPAKSFVRFVAVLLLLAGVAVGILTIVYFENISRGVATIAIIGSVGTVAASVEAIRTGRPEWILLNLILPW